MINSQKDMEKLVLKWGFIPLLRNDIPGFSVEECTARELWFVEGVDGPWEWKGPVIAHTGCAYGKFYSGSALFISPEWFPDFANYRRDGYDFDALYDDGLARRSDKYLYELLDSRDSFLSSELKQLGGYGKNGRKGFDSSITRLQMRCYALISGFEYRKTKSGNSYGWGVARYTTPEKLFGMSFAEKVYANTPEESRQRITAHLTKLLPKASEKQILKLVG